MRISANARVTYVWVVLCAVTILSGGLAHTRSDGAYVASTTITLAVLVIGLIKVRLITQNFMEVRVAPTWLRLTVDGWLVLFWGSVIAIYLI
ncbi:cytochrome C oxidase subunit IV family protein [Aldersonia kunmingensis]|uniref:cytochrome C oxidase subunit IV family protein n=1 Tax=Aldersonia kunmingensis TaxID=408066 RepID=UPI00082D4250|nr:cytochrome C oxidase subunit IV family protein [Aldersonia kunmingensis]